MFPKIKQVRKDLFHFVKRRLEETRRPQAGERHRQAAADLSSALSELVMGDADNTREGTLLHVATELAKMKSITLSRAVYDVRLTPHYNSFVMKKQLVKYSHECRR